MSEQNSNEQKHGFPVSGDEPRPSEKPSNLNPPTPKKPQSQNPKSQTQNPK